MSRVAKMPVSIPKGVEVDISANSISVKGKNNTLKNVFHEGIEIIKSENPNDGHTELLVKVKTQDKTVDAQAGTVRALLNNMIIGVTVGFEKSLELIGTGYKANAKGNILALSLGHSHPIDFEIPAGIVAETPNPTLIVVKGASKQLVGQVASQIRKMRPPEPYKGKGIRYFQENIKRKETKKK